MHGPLEVPVLATCARLAASHWPGVVRLHPPLGSSHNNSVVVSDAKRPPPAGNVAAEKLPLLAAPQYAGHRGHRTTLACNTVTLTAAGGKPHNTPQQVNHMGLPCPQHLSWRCQTACQTVQQHTTTLASGVSRLWAQKPHCCWQVLCCWRLLQPWRPGGQPHTPSAPPRRQGAAGLRR